MAPWQWTSKQSRGRYLDRNDVKKYSRTKSSARWNLINLLRTGGRTIVFADFDAPLRLIPFREKALLPCIAGIAHRQARSLRPARATKVRGCFLHGSILSRVSRAMDPDHARPHRMAGS